ncbi:LysR family transcriptional regulator [Glaciibacter superstes]|uniref:LysR family transcriptional regulator n=1 Tax=Glaciibacter superstes TaxID=501023 RepID=UPI0003B63C3B|nr:LysR family transcriptional regulator [Glaciibacter superstes]
MTLAQVRAFLNAFEHGSFTAAAVTLSTSQASISELISRLEDELGLSLFTRGSRKLIPTAAAIEFRGFAQQALASLDAGVEALRSISSLESGVTQFGVLRNAGYYDLGDLVQRFHTRYPKVRVRMVGLNSGLVAESIAAGEIEAGLVVLPFNEEGLVVKPLFKDEVLFASTTRRLDAGAVTIEEMAAARNLILYDAHSGWKDPTRRQILERSQLAGVKIDPVIEVEHVETAIRMVASGAGETMVCRTISESSGFPGNIRTFPFSEPLYDTIALVQREGTFLSPATREIARLAERTLLAKVGAQKI